MKKGMIICSLLFTLCFLFSSCFSPYSGPDGDTGTVTFYFGSSSHARNAFPPDPYLQSIMQYEIEFFSSSAAIGIDPPIHHFSRIGRGPHTIAVSPDDYYLSIQALLPGIEYANWSAYVSVSPGTNSVTANMTVDTPVLTNISQIIAFIDASVTPTVPLVLAIPLNPTSWTGIISAIQTAGQDVNLDLTLCQLSGGVFDPDPADFSAVGKSRIIELTLPDAATSIIGTLGAVVPTFVGFDSLQTVIARNVIDVGDFAFVGRSLLHSVELPHATIIGDNAFQSCTSLANLYIPAITTFGARVFESTGTQALNITMGFTAPSVLEQTFDMAGNGKTITVNVPTVATGYGALPVSISGPYSGTPAWGYGFRSFGWIASATPPMQGGGDNEFVNLVIQALP
jgi:hypothetical protein